MDGDSGSFGVGFGGSSGLAGFGGEGPADVASLLGFDVSPSFATDAALGALIGGLMGFIPGVGGLLAGLIPTALSAVAPGWSGVFGFSAPVGGPLASVGVGDVGAGAATFLDDYVKDVLGINMEDIRYDPYTAPIISDPYQRMIGYTPKTATPPLLPSKPQGPSTPMSRVEGRLRRQPILSSMPSQPPIGSTALAALGQAFGTLGRKVTGRHPFKR